jgi:hypothetical protein
MRGTAAVLCICVCVCVCSGTGGTGGGGGGGGLVGELELHIAWAEAHTVAVALLTAFREAIKRHPAVGTVLPDRADSDAAAAAAAAVGVGGVEEADMDLGGDVGVFTRGNRHGRGVPKPAVEVEVHLVIVRVVVGDGGERRGEAGRRMEEDE